MPWHGPVFWCYSKLCSTKTYYGAARLGHWQVFLWYSTLFVRKRVVFCYTKALALTLVLFVQQVVCTQKQQVPSCYREAGELTGGLVISDSIQKSSALCAAKPLHWLLLFHNNCVLLRVFIAHQRVVTKQTESVKHSRRSAPRIAIVVFQSDLEHKGLEQSKLYIWKRTHFGWKNTCSLNTFSFYASSHKVSH